MNWKASDWPKPGAPAPKKKDFPDLQAYRNAVYRYRYVKGIENVQQKIHETAQAKSRAMKTATAKQKPRKQKVVVVSDESDGAVSSSSSD